MSILDLLTGVKISALPSASNLQSTDVLAGVQGQTTKKFTLSALVQWFRQFINASDIGAVPDTREINGYELTQDVTLDAADVGARPDDWTPTASDVGAVPVSREINGHALSADVTLTASDVGLGNVDNVRQYSANNPPPYPVTSVNGNTGAVTVSVPSPYASNPAMDGTASAGSSGDYARGDHVHPSDTSKANQAQLAVVETGSTASRNYAAGEYFCRNGQLYRAKTTISLGAPFTDGTNCEAVTVGADLYDAYRHFKYFSLAAGKTLTVSVGNNSNNISALVLGYGAGAEASAVYYCTAYGANTSSYKVAIPLNTASIVSVQTTNSGFTITNTHTSHGLNINMLFFESEPGTAAFSIS